MSGPAPFQLRTAIYAFNRLWGPGNVQNFLVADEVGLGKTHVAREVVRRTLDRFPIGDADIVYVCSNQAIASQNLERLVPEGFDSQLLTTRLTLMAAGLNRGSADVRFIALTPQTSFNIGSSAGLIRERALIWSLIRGRLRPQGLEELLTQKVKAANWTSAVQAFDTNKPDDDIKQRFQSAVMSDARLIEDLRELAAAQVDGADTAAHRKASKVLIGRLREHLAFASLNAVARSGLVIMDEFQRFSDLLTGASDDAPLPARLASHLLGPGAPDRRVLLLSATPYRIPGSAAGDAGAHADLVSLMRFLAGDEKANALGLALGQFARALRAGSVREAEILAARNEAQLLLRSVMARTERTSRTTTGDAMIEERTDLLDVRAEDIAGGVTIRITAREIKARDPTEYWKSAPYALEFMRDYELHRRLQDCGEPEQRKRAKAARQVGLLLRPELINRLAPIAHPNARMRALVEDALPMGAERLLWVPPSLPCIRLTGTFASARRDLKRLVFSEWRLVPDAISTLVSYEVERRLGHDLAVKLQKRQKTSATRRVGYEMFGKSKEKLRLFASRRMAEPGINSGVLAILLPSEALATLVDPLQLASGLGRCLEPQALERKVRAILRKPLEELTQGRKTRRVDDRWYWAAPLLLDRRKTIQAWLALQDPFSERSNRSGEPLRESLSALLRSIVDTSDLGAPPSDLVEILARISIAGPATCALRAFQRVDSTGPIALKLRAAFHTARGFQALFNQPEAAAAIELEQWGAGAFWRQALAYSLSGDIQALLDEQIHLEWDAVSRDRIANAGSRLQATAQSLHDVASLRRVHIETRGLRGPGRRRADQPDGRRLRCRHAVRFTEVQDEDGVMRLDAVRDAFNSPFRPFVLASTSVGQEGLDFHRWCHAVVHWNLPHTPVELEQREGRVNRYKGHAVRLNIASGVGFAAMTPDLKSVALPNPWSMMFEHALRGPSLSELAPYWIYEGCDAPVRVQRIVPLLAFSKEAEAWPELRRRLGLYRLALGLPRYDDLISALAQNGVTLVQSKLWQIDLSPP